MSALEFGSIAGLLGLGALHGVNPAMGWLFAVALGLQERKGRAVWRALPPLALGHLVAVAVVVLVAAMLGQVVPQRMLQWIVAATLLTFGIHRLLRGHRHPRYGGMRVSQRQLTIWSFLMASAHGAGLMVLPLVLGDVAAADAAAHAVAHGAHATHASVMDGPMVALAASAVHALGYILVAASIATVVYRKLGLELLRTAWINLDLIWAGALIVTAVLTPLL